jgi:hypothetical protein
MLCIGVSYDAIFDFEEQVPEKRRIGYSEAIKGNSGKRWMDKIQPYG